MRWTRIALAVFIILALAGGAGSYYLYSQLRDIEKEAKADRSKIDSFEKQLDELKKEIKAAEEKKDKDEDDGNENDGKKQAEKASESGNTVVTSPMDGDAIGDPVTVTGRAIAFESTFNLRVKDAAGNILKETSAMTNAPGMGEFGDFSVTLDYATPSTPTGTIEVFQYSAKDGSEIDKVIIDVKFKK